MDSSTAPSGLSNFIPPVQEHEISSGDVSENKNSRFKPVKKQNLHLVRKVASTNIQPTGISKTKADKERRPEVIAKFADQKNISTKINRSESKPEIISQTSKNRSSSLKDVVKRYYEETKDPLKKAACIHYLLHYQHYNAEFTSNDRKLLNYPEPLCASEDKPGYVRLQHTLLIVMEKWLEKNINPKLVGDKKSIPKTSFIRLSHPLIGLTAIQILFSNRIFINIENLSSEKIAEIDSTPNPVIVFSIMLSDFSQENSDIAMLRKYLSPLNQLKENCKSLHFIFLVKNQENSCQVMWAAKWEKNGELDKGALEYITLSTLLDDDKISSFLNHIGDIPDRLEVNKFISQGLIKEKFDNVSGKLELSFTILNYKSSIEENWNKQLEKITKYNFNDNSGAELYRDAILRWNSCFFEKYQ